MKRRVAFIGELGDRQLDREFPARAVEGGDFDPATDDRADTGLEVTLEASRMRLPVLRGHDQLAHHAADRFLAGPTKSLLGAVVPVGNGAITPHHDDGIERFLEEKLKRVHGCNKRASVGKVQLPLMRREQSR